MIEMGSSGIVRTGALEHYWQIYWASYWNSRSKQFTVPVNPVTGSNVDP